jgi:hypothetical protein
MPPRTRIDQRHGPRAARDGHLARHDSTELRRPDRETGAESRLVVPDAGFVHLRCEQEETADERARLLAQSSGRDPRLSLIPAERAFDGAEVADLGLDLDDYQQAMGRLAGEDVDPAARSVSTDLDLGRRQPAVSLEPSRDVRRAASVGRIALELAIGEEGSRNGESEPGAHGLEQPRCVCKCEVWPKRTLDP